MQQVLLKFQMFSWAVKIGRCFILSPRWISRPLYDFDADSLQTSLWILKLLFILSPISICFCNWRWGSCKSDTFFTLPATTGTETRWQWQLTWFAAFQRKQNLISRLHSNWLSTTNSPSFSLINSMLDPGHRPRQWCGRLQSCFSSLFTRPSSVWGPLCCYVVLYLSQKSTCNSALSNIRCFCLI